MKPKLAIATGNPLKFRELSLALHDFFDCELVEIQSHEIQGKPEDILKHKLESAYAATKKPTLVDDTSFEIERLGGFPGPYMKDFTKALTIAGIGKMFDGSPAKAVSLVGIIFGDDDYVIGRGEVEGTVVQEKETSPKESDNFDPIFMPKGYEKTFIQMTTEEKNKISHRGLAVQDLLKKLKLRTAY